MKLYSIIFLLGLGLCSFYPNHSGIESSVYYNSAYNGISDMLSGKEPINFQKAVFLTENAYHADSLNISAFNDLINFYAMVSSQIIASGNIEYTEKDKDIAMAQCAVFMFLTDSIPMIFDDKVVVTMPFSYNYEDYAGKKDWSNMFVSTLMLTQKGNCHSLPYLYKMIMDKLDQHSCLALAPNHIYIKVNNKKVGWYNIELTNADFPTDAWLMASGYIHIDAIRNGIYMKALSDKEAVAMTLVDLAQGYQAKFGIGDGTFMIKCCDTALTYFPNYINALLLKGEILTEMYRQSPDSEKMELMTDLYSQIHELGYRKMPNEMYINWLNSLTGDNTEQRMKSVIIKK